MIMLNSRYFVPALLELGSIDLGLDTPNLFTTGARPTSLTGPLYATSRVD